MQIRIHCNSEIRTTLLLSTLLSLTLEVKMFERIEIYFLIGVVAAIASLLNAECPPASDVPVMCEYRNNTFNCARAWDGIGSDEPIQGCNNCSDVHPSIDDYYDYRDGEDWPGWPGAYFEIGSLLVLPGCKFYGFSEQNYKGNVQNFDSDLHSNVQAPYDYGDGCANAFLSTKCRCEQELVSCEPVDGKWRGL